ncbi:unnamed protein product [Paramecium primaurelia]|uniref:EGF-like domain-containing protein n=1 Tax=Paramecium primaurelia TaxID=5886 RepID=A0A8S1L573_PARPR|nr:unnamed protein product [Paramecium primaurelia]
MVSKQGRWGFSEFYLSADLLNNYQQNFELIYQSLNNLKFTSVASEDGWMTNSIISLQVFQCTDFNYLKSTGNNLMKDFVLKNHFKISFNLKVLIFNQTPTTIEIKIDNQLVSTYHSNSFVTSSLILCNNFIVIKVQVEDFIHNHNNLRIEVITLVNGSSSWFGIRDFQLFTTKIDYFCQDLNNQPFDGCFSNYYDCNFGCSNCIKGTCIKCLDGLILDIQNTCIPICGDRKIILNEACDDGNQIPYDGCHLCQFSCPLNCILCNFGICQVCEQSYFLQGNKCINDQQICDTFIELLETGFFYQMINYNENGYQFQQYHILQNIQNCYNFKDYFGILGYQYYYCQIIENCKLSIYETSQECQVSYKLSLNNRQCIQICNCEDQINFQYNDCYKCRQNCQLECLMCIQYKCYQCLDGWQLIDHKCQQICGDKQVALFSPEQCDNGNDIIDDGCHECQLQCQAYCQICSQDSICIICQQNFELINNKCQPICGDKIVIYGFEECDDGNDIQYDGCFQCQFQCNYGCQVCESGKCLIQCKEEEEFKNGECIFVYNVIKTIFLKIICVQHVEMELQTMTKNAMMETE